MLLLVHTQGAALLYFFISLIQVVWARLYCKGTSTEKGTLLQLKNLINRTSVPRDPKNDVNSSEEFFELVFAAHAICAVMVHFDMNSVNDTIKSFPPNICTCDPDTKRDILQSALKSIISNHVNLSLDGAQLEGKDKVLSYAQHVFTLGLIHGEYKDAIHEGDGLRVIRCWRLLLPLFKSANRKNYALEALNLLWQYNVVLSPREKMQLVWSRFVNTKGKPGCNVACDMHMEHMNRACKDILHHLGANISNQSIVRAGKCIGPITKVTERFDSETNIASTLSSHSAASMQKDLSTIIQELSTNKVFVPHEERLHKSFATMTNKVFMKMKKDELFTWMLKNIQIPK